MSGSVGTVGSDFRYLGKIRYKDEVHEGEHKAIVDGELFRRGQELLTSQSAARSATARNKHGGLLRGILRCAACDCGMVHTYTSKGARRYRYYVCAKAQQRGWDSCPAPSIAAPEIERFVIDQLRCIGRDPALVAATVAETRRQRDEAIQGLKRERAALEHQRRDDAAEIGRLGAGQGSGAAKRAEIESRMSGAAQRLAEIRDEVDRVTSSVPSDNEAAAALAEFDRLWAVLTPGEQANVIGRLVSRVEYNASGGDVAITFNPTCLTTIEAAGKLEETAA